MSGGEEETFLGKPDVLTRGEPRESSSLSPREETAAPEGIAVQVPVPEEVRESYLEVREPPGQEVVTVIEVLSPTNKARTDGRRLYLRKRRRLLSTSTNLVEIDLLRSGRRMPILGEECGGDYSILIARGAHRPDASLILFLVQDRIPPFPVPLREGEEEPRIDLERMIDDIFESSRYDLDIDYRSEPKPPLDPAVRPWADGLLRQAGLR